MLKNHIAKLLLLLLFLPQCSSSIKKTSTTPPAVDSFSSLNGKIYFRNDQFKFSGKILLSFDQIKDKILFLSPMNQVYFKLLVQDEHAVLVNLKKRRYWQGPFHLLFLRMGKVNITYQELKELILQGTIPATDQSYSVKIQKRGKDGSPQRILIEGRLLVVRFRLRSLKTRKGEIHFKINRSRLVQANLGKTLSLDD